MYIFICVHFPSSFSSFTPSPSCGFLFLICLLLCPYHLLIHAPPPVSSPPPPRPLLLPLVVVRSYLRLLGCWLRASCTVSSACCRCFWALSRRLSRWRECRSSPRRDSATCRGSIAAETYHTHTDTKTPCSFLLLYLVVVVLFRRFDIVEDGFVSILVGQTLVSS